MHAHCFASDIVATSVIANLVATSVANDCNQPCMNTKKPQSLYGTGAFAHSFNCFLTSFLPIAIALFKPNTAFWLELVCDLNFLIKYEGGGRSGGFGTAFGTGGKDGLGTTGGKFFLCSQSLKDSPNCCFASSPSSSKEQILALHHPVAHCLMPLHKVHVLSLKLGDCGPLLLCHCLPLSC